MKKTLILFSTIIMSLGLWAQNNAQAYAIFDAKGNKTDFGVMVNDLAKNQVVLIGELHNNPIAHWMELRITEALYSKNNKIVQGAEMFEADVQLILDEFLNDDIREKDVKSEARVWPNYPTDYKPLLMFAKEHNLKFVATNIPRRYANLVYRKGFEGLDKLSPEAKKYIAPLPVKYDPNLACYKNMISGATHMGMPANPNIAKAQAIKDATMAHFIYKNLPKGGIFVHYEGAYHSDNYQGIYWYLKQTDKKLKIGTVTTVEQDDLSKLDKENIGRADFIIVVPTDMTKTY